MHVTIPRVKGEFLTILGIVCHLRKDVPLVACMAVVGIDDTNGVVELETILETKATTRETCKEPSVIDDHSNTRGDLHGLTSTNFKTNRGVEVITGRTSSCTRGKFDRIVEFTDLLIGEHF